MDPLEAAWRAEHGRVVATLARRLGDLGLAEDAVQEAYVAAAQRWPSDGVPRRPGAWLTTTAHRKALDVLRARRPETHRRSDGPDSLEPVAPGGSEPPAPTDHELDTDLFGLLVTCCHPALAPEARIALTLRHVCGLDDTEIASALLVATPTLTKRLVRARRRIRDTGLSFDGPAVAALPDRVHDVLIVIYAVFTQGHTGASGTATLRGDLCDEAMWLARQVHRLQPDHGEAAALLALLLAHDARRRARTGEGPDGMPLGFDEQDRSLWDLDAVDEARGLLRAGAESGRAGRFALEATIALLHMAADGPPWRRIAQLYGVLGRVAPSPVVEVQRAYALGRCGRPVEGLEVVDQALAAGGLATYAPAQAVRADLLERVEDTEGSARAWTAAASLTTHAGRRAAMLGEAARVRATGPAGLPAPTEG